MPLRVALVALYVMLWLRVMLLALVGVTGAVTQLGLILRQRYWWLTGVLLLTAAGAHAEPQAQQRWVVRGYRNCDRAVLMSKLNPEISVHREDTTTPTCRIVSAGDCCLTVRGPAAFLGV